MSEPVEPEDGTIPLPTDAKPKKRRRRPPGQGAGPEVLALGFFVAIFLLTIAAFIYVLSDFITDFILALLFAFLAKPMYNRLLPELWNKPWLASTVVCGVIVVIVSIPTSFLIASLSAEAVTAFDATRESMTAARIEESLFGDTTVARTVRRAAELGGVEYTPDSVREFISQVAGALAGFVGQQVNLLLSSVLGAVMHFMIIIIIVFYLLIDGRKLKAYVYRLSPLPVEEEDLLTKQFGSVGRAILFGNGIGSVIQGVIGGLTMAAFGLPSVVLWATVMTIFAFLPLVGIMVVVVPAAIIMALNGHVVAAIAFFSINLVQGLVVENVVKTKLIGSHMKMHNLLIFLSIIGGLAAFGVIGILYGPLVVAMFLTLVRIYETHYESALARRYARRA